MPTLTEDFYFSGQLSAATFLGPAGCIGTTQLASQSVTPPKLSTNLATGCIQLDLTTARIISAADIQNTTEAGVPDGNTAGPKLLRTNTSTDIALRIAWAATEVNEIQFAPVALPPDWDSTQNFTVNLIVEKDGNTDTTANISVKVFLGKGDSNAGTTTAAITETTPTEKAITVSAANNVAAPSFLNISLTPSAHGTDAIRVYAAWIEYQRAA